MGVWLKTKGHKWAEEEQELGTIWNLVGVLLLWEYFSFEGAELRWILQLSDD